MPPHGSGPWQNTATESVLFLVTPGCWVGSVAGGVAGLVDALGVVPCTGGGLVAGRVLATPLVPPWHSGVSSSPVAITYCISSSSPSRGRPGNLSPLLVLSAALMIWYVLAPGTEA